MEFTEKHFSYSGGSTTLHIFPATSSKAPTIIALHGFTGLGSDFAPCAHIAHGAFSWICPDLPGHGDHKTSLPYIEAVYRLLNALFQKHQTEVHLLGYSMGARLSLSYALDAHLKLSSLKLVSGTAGLETSRERFQRLKHDIELAKHIREIPLQNFLKEWSQHPIIQSQKNIPSPWKEDIARKRLAKHTSEALAEALVQFSPGKLPSRWVDLHTLKSPLSCYFGSNDGKYKKLAKRFPNNLPQTQLVEIPQCGHAPHLENTVSFVKDGLLQKNIKNK